MRNYLSSAGIYNSPAKCTCGLQLGKYQLTQKDILESKEFEHKYKIVQDSILFLGRSNSSEHCKIIDKINEIKVIRSCKIS